MKKVVVFGSSGMAGHMVYKYLESLGEYDLMGISRTIVPEIKSESFDIESDFEECIDYLDQFKPDVIINCIGLLVKSCEEDPTRAIFVNSMWPHALENICQESGARLIHISSDCIFDGKQGPYTEQDWPTEKNWYGRTKSLGEVVNSKDLTIRTSIIGPELKDDGVGLFGWFMRQSGDVSGFINVMWNGITTLELAKQIHTILGSNLAGLYHLVTEIPIAKGELLTHIQNIWAKTDVEIKPTSSVPSNKVLLNNRIGEYDPKIPMYAIQLEEMKDFYTSG